MGQLGDGADPDVEIGEPTPIDDDYIKPEGFQPLDGSHATPNSLLILVPVGRLVHQLRKQLKNRFIAPGTLKIIDEYFQSIADSYPDPFPISSTTPLDPHLLYPATALHMCKFMLFRHNLTPVAKTYDRQDATARCVRVAKDTAHYIWRTTPSARGQYVSHPPDMSNPEWRNRIRHAVPSLVIKHWWRCVLILCLAGDYPPALTIIGAMAAVNDSRKINLACGRNLAFFLDLMIQKWQNGRDSEIEADEELLAYASGDLQGSSYSSWAWAGSDSRNNSQGSSSSPSRMSPPGDAYVHENVASQPVLLTEEEEREWGGWSKVEDMIRHLQYLRSTRRSPHSSPDEHRPAPPHYAQAPPAQPQQHRYSISNSVASSHTSHTSQPQQRSLQSPYHQSFPSPSLSQRHSPPTLPPLQKPTLPPMSVAQSSPSQPASMPAPAAPKSGSRISIDRLI